MVSCQSRILSDLVCLDIPHVECVMFDIKFAYLKIVVVTWDFWFSGVIHLFCSFSIFCKLDLAKYSSCNTWFNHITSVIPVTGISNTLTVVMLGIPRHQEGVCGLKPAWTCCSLQKSYTSCLVFVLNVGLSQLCTSLVLVWQTRETFILF